MIEVDLVQTGIQLLVSPNPASSNANIFVQTAKDFNSPIEISVMEVSGRIVFRKNISEQDFFHQQLQISLGNLRSGMYFIKVRSRSHLLASEKLLVE